MDTQIKNFINTYYPIAQKMERKYGIPAYALLSQIALESNFGTSNFAQNRNNPSGLGAYNSDPNQAFTFDTLEDAIDYQARIQMAKAKLPQNQRGLDAKYGATAPILADRKNPPESVFAAMQDSPYSTDSDYAEKLMVRYNQIKPFIENFQPPPSSTGQVKGTKRIQNPHPGKTIIYSPKGEVEYVEPDRQALDKAHEAAMNRQAANTPANFPGYIKPEPPPQTLDINKIGSMLGGLWSSIMNRGKT